MHQMQPKPDSKKYTDLINEIQNGVVKIPKFQRDFVWSIDKTAGLLDSILKGYPIGTFILWQTDQRINEIKNIGNLAIPDDGHASNMKSRTPNNAQQQSSHFQLLLRIRNLHQVCSDKVR